MAAGFVADDGAARQLARLLSHSVEWQPSLGCEGLTADAVNQILINVLQGLDRCAAFPFAQLSPSLRSHHFLMPSVLQGSSAWEAAV